MFREYVSIPQVRLACQISDKGSITQVGAMFLYTEKVGAISERIEFSSDKAPAIGDYIISEASGYYLMPQEDFEERFKSTTYRIG